MSDVTAARVRREPPPLRLVRVTDRIQLGPRLLRLAFAGDDLRLMDTPELASSVRLLVPSPGSDELVIPTWNGNEFLLPDGSRPALRTFTPLRFDGDAGTLELEIVRHPGGAVSTWAEHVEVGARAALSGPGRGWDLEPSWRKLVLAGDETAIPAMGQIVAAAPEGVAVDVHAEVVDAAAVIAELIPEAPSVSVTWHVVEPGEAPGARLVAAIGSLAELPADHHVWAAGEAASMQAIRKHLFDELGAARSQATIRGYWKPARP